MNSATTRKQDALALVNQKKKDLLALVSNDPQKYEQYKAVMVELTQNQNLKNCSIVSIIQSATRIIQLGLNPNPLLAEAYVVPRGVYEYDQRQGKRVKTGEVAELQIGTKGYKILGYRAGWTFSYQAVYKCDAFEEILGEMVPTYKLTPNHEKRDEDNGAWVFKNLKGIIVFAKDPRGNIHKGYIRKQKLEKIRMNSPTQRFSKNELKGIWLDWAEEMYAKSGLKYFIKRLPIDSSIMDVIIQDEEGERETATTDNAIEAKIVTPNESPVLKKGKDIANAVKGMGLSLYPFEGRAVVDGNAFNHSVMLKELGFVCEDNEWYFEFERGIDFVQSIVPEVEVIEQEGFLGVKGRQNEDIEAKLQELGFSYFNKKQAWVLKLSAKIAA